MVGRISRTSLDRRGRVEEVVDVEGGGGDDDELVASHVCIRRLCASEDQGQCCETKSGTTTSESCTPMPQQGETKHAAGVVLIAVVATVHE